MFRAFISNTYGMKQKEGIPWSNIDYGHDSPPMKLTLTHDQNGLLIWAAAVTAPSLSDNDIWVKGSWLLLQMPLHTVLECYFIWWGTWAGVFTVYSQTSAVDFLIRELYRENPYGTFVIIDVTSRYMVVCVVAFPVTFLSHVPLRPTTRRCFVYAVSIVVYHVWMQKQIFSLFKNLNQF